MELGIFIRGQLIGTKNDSNTSKKTGETFSYSALGINIPFKNSFGHESIMTKEIRISKQKMNDAAFLKSLEDNYNKYVEIEIGVGDFRNLFVTQNATLTILDVNQLKAAS